MKIKFLLLGTSLSFIPTLTFAQCVATQDCETLGYTETSCNGGKGVKCPFGNKWACLPTKESICKEEGFTLACNETGQTGGDSCNGLYKQCSCDSSYQYTCSGTGYSGGSGTACNGKYTSCTCASDYEWNNGTCISSRPVCEIGSLYYSDNTCSNNLESGKTLLGVVIYSNTPSVGGWIMTIRPIQTGIAWSTEKVDIPGLSNCTSISCITDIQASCTNTTTITNYGNSSKYPAAWAAKNYKPSGTPNGKTWCLPSSGLLNKGLNNSTNLDKINTGITTAGGKKIGFGSSYSFEYPWASSEYSYESAWTFYADSRGSFDITYGTKYGIGSASVRPVLEF